MELSSSKPKKLLTIFKKKKNCLTSQEGTSLA